MNSFMKYIKYTAHLVFSALIFCLLFSCGNDNTEPTDSSAGSVEDDIHFELNSDQYTFCKSQGGLPSMASSESGYYFTVGDKYLYYVDKTSTKPVALCNKPNCKHAGETGSRKCECNALLTGGDTFSVGDILYYDSSVYYFRIITGSDEVTKYRLTKVSLDGTQRNDVYTFKVYPQYIMIHQGYLYFTTEYSEDESDQTDSNNCKSELYRIALTHLNKEPELLYQVDGFYSTIDNLEGYQNTIYFRSASYMDETMSLVDKSS